MNDGLDRNGEHLLRLTRKGLIVPRDSEGPRICDRSRLEPLSLLMRYVGCRRNRDGHKLAATDHGPAAVPDAVAQSVRWPVCSFAHFSCLFSQLGNAGAPTCAQQSNTDQQMSFRRR